jgi:hypothetical protein
MVEDLTLVVLVAPEHLALSCYYNFVGGGGDTLTRVVCSAMGILLVVCCRVH